MWPLLLFGLIVAFAQTNAEKKEADSASDWSTFELIPKDQLCLLCHNVIQKFQQASTRNPEQFKNDLLTSCALLKDPAEIQKCRDGITDDQLRRLNAASVSQICIAQKLCKETETLDSSGAQPSATEENTDEFEPIPDVENPNIPHDDPQGFKVSNKAQDLIQSAYA